MGIMQRVLNFMQSRPNFARENFTQVQLYTWQGTWNEYTDKTLNDSKSRKFNFKWFFVMFLILSLIVIFIRN